jgi:HEAT repeat protein
MERIAFADNAEGAGLLVNVGLKDESFHVRDRATYALSTSETPEAISVIAERVADRNEFAQGGCLPIALARMKSAPKASSRDIAVVAETAKKEEVRISACEALGIIGSKDGTKARWHARRGP